MQALEILNTFIQEFAGHSPEVMHTMRLLLGNQQGRTLAQITVSPDQPTLCQMLSGIVVHTVSVVLNRTRVNLLLPFVNMLNNPSALEVSKHHVIASLIYEQLTPIECLPPNNG